MVDSMDYFYAFLVGGLICVIGQIILDNTKLTPAHILLTFLILGAIVSALGLYEPLVEFAGAGASIPLSGFGHTLAQGAIEGAKSEGFLGALTGGLKSSAAGISAAIILGYLMAIIFKPKTKG